MRDSKCPWATYGASHSLHCGTSVPDGVSCRSHTQMLVCSCCCKLQTVAKMEERNCGGAIGHEEGIGSRGSWSCLQGNEITMCESVFDGLDWCNLEWKLHESTFGNGFDEQSPNDQRLAPESPVIFTTIMELVLRDQIKSWITRWRGDWTRR